MAKTFICVCYPPAYLMCVDINEFIKTAVVGKGRKILKDGGVKKNRELLNYLLFLFVNFFIIAKD